MLSNTLIINAFKGVICINSIISFKNIIKVILFLSIQLTLLSLIFFINQKFKLNLSEDTLAVDFGFFVPITGALTFLPSLRKVFLNQLTTSGSSKVIFIPILICSTLGYIKELTRYIPLLFNSSYVSVASGQAIDNTGMFTISSFVFIGFFPGFNEEFIFRFLSYSGLKMMLTEIQFFLKSMSTYKNTFSRFNLYICKKLEWFYLKFYIQKDKKFLAIWIVTVSTLFSLSHFPDKTNFYMYFVSGSVYAYLFLRYGLLASMIGHAMHNYFSSFNFWLAGITIKFFFN